MMEYEIDRDYDEYLELRLMRMEKEEKVGAASFKDIINERKEKKAMLKKNALLLKEGMNEQNTGKTKLALTRICSLFDDEDCLLYPENLEEDLILKRLSIGVWIIDKIRKGERNLNYCRADFNPLLGSAEELLEVSALSDGKYYKAITVLVWGTANFIEEVEEAYPESLKAPIWRYMEYWMKGCIRVIKENIEGLLSENDECFSNNDDPDGPLALGYLIISLIKEKRLKTTLDNLFSELGDYIIHTMNYHPNPLDRAIDEENEEVFDYLINLEGIKRDYIENYPLNSLHILSSLFDKGILLPGSGKGRKAFFSLIINRNPSHEVLKRIIHPSYFDGNDYYGSPLCAVSGNMNFSPENLDLLIRSEADINGVDGKKMLPPLANVIANNDVGKMIKLFELGADYNWHDSRGNNILHYVYGMKMISNGQKDIDDALFRVFWLKEEENQYGRTPLDYRNGIKGSREGMELIEEKEVYLKIFEKGIGRSADTFFLNMFDLASPLLNHEKVRRMIKESTGLEDERIYTIGNEKELDEFYRIIKDKTKSYVAIIDMVDIFFGKDRDKAFELLSIDNVTVLASALLLDDDLWHDAVTSSRIQNIVTAGMHTAFESEIYLSRAGAETLERGEYIFKHGTEYYLTHMKAVSRLR